MGEPTPGPLSQPLTAGAVASVTGFASSFVLVLAGLAAVGASPAQAASGLLALCLAQFVLAALLSWRTRLPLSFVWSTPGAALLVAAQGRTGSLGAAVGAFLLCALLVVVTGAWPALARLVRRVPTPVAGALLAGVLFPLCLAPVTAVRRTPVVAVLVVWCGSRCDGGDRCSPCPPRWSSRSPRPSRPAHGAALHWVPTLTPVLPQFDPTSSSPSACPCTS